MTTTSGHRILDALARSNSGSVGGATSCPDVIISPSRRRLHTMQRPKKMRYYKGKECVGNVGGDGNREAMAGTARVDRFTGFLRTSPTAQLTNKQRPNLMSSGAEITFLTDHAGVVDSSHRDACVCRHEGRAQKQWTVRKTRASARARVSSTFGKL